MFGYRPERQMLNAGFPICCTTTKETDKDLPPDIEPLIRLSESRHLSAKEDA
jgi:hypothetical protein